MLKFMNLLNNTYNITRSSYHLVVQTMSSTTQPAFKKTKYDGRSKKRRWEDRRSDKGVSLHPEKKQCDDTFVRIKRRKYTMLLGYCGVNYLGMQRNPSMRTIEEDLFTALLKTNLITQEAFEQIQTIQFQRAARTDKGVSAARQVVSIKLPEEVDVSKINESLPEAIRVFGVKRVTKGFNSKSQCDGRTYTYMLPTVAFAKSNTEALQETFQLSTEALKEVNELMATFIGTKNFHNFTCKKKANDPSAKRYIISFECEPPVIRKGVEFAVIKVKGQSFMLHQIRKMVGLVLAVIKGYTPTETLTKAWTQEKINIPRAPGLGLVLDQVHYDNYNYRYGSDGIHETLEWTEEAEQVEAFKEKHIYPTIIDTEINEKTMLEWLGRRLSTHRFDILEEETQGSDEEHSSDDEDKPNNEPEKETTKEAIDNSEVKDTNIKNVENSANTESVKCDVQKS